MINHIYVINLEQSINRLENVKKTFANLNLNFNKFKAIKGTDLDNNIINTRTTSLCRNILCNKSMMGCSLSHITLWEQLLNDTNTEYYIIMEDDVILKPDFKNIINIIDKNKDNINFEILNLFHHTKILNIPINKIYKLDDKYQVENQLFPVGLTGYIISKSGARKLLKYMKTIHYHVDFEMILNSKLYNIKYYGLNIPIVETNGNLDSTLANPQINSIGLYMLSKINPNIYWYFNFTVFSLRMKYNINFYIILLILLLIISFKIQNKYKIILQIFIIYELYSLFL
jgi:GR25 family glycosyltransferase involved in LPS biosynthesis